MAGSSHLKALLKKNYIQWKRNKCCSCLEICIPAFIALFLFVIRNNLEKVKKPETSYIETNPFVIYPYNNNFSDLMGNLEFNPITTKSFPLIL